MTVKDIFETATSATMIRINFCVSREDALNEMVVDQTFVTKDNISNYADMEVTFTYPRRKDVLDIYIVRGTALESACRKLGTKGFDYLENRSERINKLITENRDTLAEKNEGRIEGYLRALEHSGRFTAEEMTALSNHFPDHYVG